MTNSDSSIRPRYVFDTERSRRSMRRWGIAALVGALVFVTLAAYTYLSNTGQDERIRLSEQKLTEQSEVIAKQNDVIGQVCRVAGGQVDNDAQTRQYCSRVESGLPAVPALVTTDACPTSPCGLRVEFTITDQGVLKHCVRDGNANGLPAYRCTPVNTRTLDNAPPLLVAGDR